MRCFFVIVAVCNFLSNTVAIFVPDGLAAVTYVWPNVTFGGHSNFDFYFAVLAKPNPDSFYTYAVQFGP